jgi:hypothetical protein
VFVVTKKKVYIFARDAGCILYANQHKRILVTTEPGFERIKDFLRAGRQQQPPPDASALGGFGSGTIAKTQNAPFMLSGSASGLSSNIIVTPAAPFPIPSPAKAQLYS